MCTNPIDMVNRYQRIRGERLEEYQREIYSEAYDRICNSDVHKYMMIVRDSISLGMFGKISTYTDIQDRGTWHHDDLDIIRKCTTVIAQYSFDIPRVFTEPVGCMTTTNARFTSANDDDEDMIVHERDIQWCVPVQYPLVAIKSNFGHIWDPDYQPKIKTKKVNRVRRQRSIQGLGTSFNSQAALSIVHPDTGRMYTVRVFRKNKLVIVNCIDADGQDAIHIANIALDHLNAAWPDCKYKLDISSIYNPTRNHKFRLVNEDKRINLDNLTAILRYIWFDEGMGILPYYRHTATYHGLIARFKSRRVSKYVTVCIQRSGRVNTSGWIELYQWLEIRTWLELLVLRYGDFIIDDYIPEYASTETETDDE